MANNSKQYSFAGNFSYITEGGKEYDLGSAIMSNPVIEEPEGEESDAIQASAESIVGHTITMQMEEPEKVRSRLLGIILLHHRRN